MNLLPYFKAGFIWCGIFLSFSCYGQFGLSSNIPLGVMPMEHNPSFAGQAGTPRLSTNFNYQGTGRLFLRDKHDLFSTHISFDHFVPAIASGIGISTSYYGNNSDFLEGGGYDISLAIAPKISIKGKYTLSPSIDISYGSLHSTYNFGRNYSYELIQDYEQEFIGSRVGILFNTNRYYIGLSFFAYNKNDHTIYYNGIRSNMNLNAKKHLGALQFGYSFQKSPESKFSFTPQIAINIIEDNYLPNERSIGPELYFNFTFRYNKYIAGVSNAGFHIGLQTEKLRLMLSNNFNLFQFGPNNQFFGDGPTSNLSLRYVFQKPDKGPGQSRF